MGDALRRLQETRRDEIVALAASPDEDLVALAGTERVKGYFRRTKTGKTVKVDAYTRSPGDMSSKELLDEQSALKGKTDSQSKNRLQQVTNEIRKRSMSGGQAVDNLKSKRDEGETASEGVIRLRQEARKKAESAGEKPKEEPKPKEGPLTRHGAEVTQRETESRRKLLEDPRSQQYHKERIERSRKEGDTRSWFDIWIAELKASDAKRRSSGKGAAPDPSVYNGVKDLTNG